jgi:hypothetical protein
MKLQTTTNEKNIILFLPLNQLRCINWDKEFNFCDSFCPWKLTKPDSSRFCSSICFVFPQQWQLFFNSSCLGWDSVTTAAHILPSQRWVLDSSWVMKVFLPETGLFSTEGNSNIHSTSSGLKMTLSLISLFYFHLLFSLSAMAIFSTFWILL